MSDDVENGGNGLVTGLGAVAGGAGSAYYLDQKLVNRSINASVAGEAAVSKTVAGKFTDAVSKNTALQTEQTALNALKTPGADKAVVAKAEQAFGKNARSAAGLRVGDGFRGLDKNALKGLNGATKLKYAGVAVAGVAAGAVVFNKLFGGQHTNRVASERAVQADMGRA